jgi:hypothetical protein
MIGFETFDGFWMLLVLPFLFWFQSRKQRLREFVTSLYPVLELDRLSRSETRRQTFRISKRLREVLFGAIFLLLALSYNGFHLTYRTDTPGEWFIVYDNTYAATARAQDISAHNWNIRELESLVSSLSDRDQFTLMVTSPQPSISPAHSKDEFISLLEEVQPSLLSPDVDRLLGMLLSTIHGEKLKGLIVVSPRAWKWDNAVDLIDPSVQINLPGYTELSGGNAGITAFDLNPAGNGKYDLFFTVQSHGRPDQGMNVDLQVEDGLVRSIPIDLDSNGAGRVQLMSYNLEPGIAQLTLDINDKFEADDRVVIKVGEQTKKIKVASDKKLRPFLGKVILSNPLVDELIIGSSDHLQKPVRIYDGTVPSEPITSPSLIIFPTMDYEDFTMERIWTTPLDPNFHPLHPITRNVRFKSFRTSKVSQLTVPEGFHVLARGEEVPLVISGDLNSHRVVIWTFDPEDNGIYLDAAFAILARETVQWLATEGPSGPEPGGICSDPVDKENHGLSYHSSASNVLCPPITEEAGRVSLVKLAADSVMPHDSKNLERRDLNRLTLILALILILLLAADSSILMGGRY